MYQGVKTPQGPMCWGVEKPLCPMYRGVAKLDLLNVQNSPKYWGVETSRYPMYWGVETPQCPMYRGVFFLFYTTFKPMQQPLKQHSFKKMLNFSIYYTNTVQFKHI